MIRKFVSRIITNNLGMLKQKLKELIFSYSVCSEVIKLVLLGLINKITNDCTNRALGYLFLSHNKNKT